MQKPADTSVPIHALLRERWSPRAFLERAVEPEVLTSLFEAARWAPSCFNAQPWTYLVGTSADPEGHARLARCLVEGNAWAHAAPVLACACAQEAFERNGKPNAWAWHDVGLASMSLVVQAQSHGLVSHQMAGFDPERTRAELAIPEGWTPVAFVALGYPGDAASLPAPLDEREGAPRDRKPLSAVYRGPRWDADPQGG